MNHNMRKMFTEEEISKLGGTKLYLHDVKTKDKSDNSNFELVFIDTEKKPYTNIANLKLHHLVSPLYGVNYMGTWKFIYYGYYVGSSYVVRCLTTDTDVQSESINLEYNNLTDTVTPL